MEGVPTPGKERTDSATRQLKAKVEEVADKGQDAWREIKKGTSNAGAEIKDGLTEAARELRT
jgi:hypothetical protein